MEFKSLVEAAEKWCSGNPFELIFAEEDDERRLDFYAEPGVSFYVLCPGGTDNFVSKSLPSIPPSLHPSTSRAFLPSAAYCVCVCLCVFVRVGKVCRGCAG